MVAWRLGRINTHPELTYHPYCEVVEVFSAAAIRASIVAFLGASIAVGGGEEAKRIADWAHKEIDAMDDATLDAVSSHFKEMGEVVSSCNSHGQGSLKTRSIAIIEPFIKHASESVEIIGINALGPLHQCRQHLLNVLNGGGVSKREGGVVSIGVLNPISKEFEIRQEKEGKHQGTGAMSTRLTAEWMASYSMARELALFMRPEKGVLKFWTYDVPPTQSLVIVDKRFVQYNPYKDGHHAGPAQAAPGLESRVEIFDITAAGGKQASDKILEFEQYEARGTLLELQPSDYASIANRGLETIRHLASQLV